MPTAISPRAYLLDQTPLPFHRSSWHRWEKKKLIRLVRIGGRTLVTAETIEGILDGTIRLPDHPARRGLAGRKKRKPTEAAE